MTRTSAVLSFEYHTALVSAFQNELKVPELLVRAQERIRSVRYGGTDDDTILNGGFRLAALLVPAVECLAIKKWPESGLNTVPGRRLVMVGPREGGGSRRARSTWTRRRRSR